jgi:hypothetical protein
MKLLLLAAAISGLLAVVVSPALSRGGLRCGNVRLNQTLGSDPHGSFGAFRIRASDTSCKNARRVATKYVHDRSAIVAGAATRIGSWSCSWRAAHEAQVVLVTCRRDEGRIGFEDVIPSG